MSQQEKERRFLKRRVLLGCVIGALPGVLFGLVPLVLESFDVITSDQSQIGFIGVPLLFVGVLLGTWIGASESAHPARMTLGVGIGFVLGLSAGIAINSILRAAGVSASLVWIFLTPTAMTGWRSSGSLAERPHRPSTAVLSWSLQAVRWMGCGFHVPLRM